MGSCFNQGVSVMEGKFQKKKRSLAERIINLPEEMRFNLIKQLKDSTTMKELYLLEKTLLLSENIKLKQKEKDFAADFRKNYKKQENEDPSNPIFLQIRFAIMKDDFIWKIKSSNFPTYRKEELIKMIEELDKDQSMDLLKKWQTLNEMKKYIPTDEQLW